MLIALELSYIAAARREKRIREETSACGQLGDNNILRFSGRCLQSSKIVYDICQRRCPLP